MENKMETTIVYWSYIGIIALEVLLLLISTGPRAKHAPIFTEDY